MNDREVTISSVPSVSSVKPEPGKFLGGRYCLLKALGRGGMGEVWRADEMDGGEKVQEVVVKIVPPERQAEMEEMRKIRESFALVRRLRHPNIAAPLTLTNDANHGVLLVMDFIDGQPLSEYLKQQPGGKFSLAETVEILAPLASALDYAHQQRIIHRDVKPQNIMVPHHAYSTRHNEVKLIDFDLAAEVFTSLDDVSREVTSTSGTIPYMPPEQLLGETQGPRSDEYSLAVLAYQMLSGGLPFNASAHAVLMYQIIHQAPPEIAGMPEHVNRAIARGMAKVRQERYDTCGEFVAALAGKGVKTPAVPPPAAPPVTPVGYVPPVAPRPVPQNAPPFPGGPKPLSELTSTDDMNRHLFRGQTPVESGENAWQRHVGAHTRQAGYDGVMDDFMVYWEYYKKAWADCTDFHSRDGRKAFWGFFIIHIIIIALTVPIGGIGGFYLLIGLLPQLAATTRRLRDIDFSGGFIFLLYLSVFVTFSATGFLILFFLLMPGTAGKNRNGPPSEHVA